MKTHPRNGSSRITPAPEFDPSKLTEKDLARAVEHAKSISFNAAKLMPAPEIPEGVHPLDVRRFLELTTEAEDMLWGAVLETDGGEQGLWASLDGVTAEASERLGTDLKDLVSATADAADAAHFLFGKMAQVAVRVRLGRTANGDGGAA